MVAAEDRAAKACDAALRGEQDRACSSAVGASGHGAHMGVGLRFVSPVAKSEEGS